MSALPLPIRVLVKGCSTVVWMSDPSGPRTDFTFPRVIEQSLLKSGRPAEVWASAVPSASTFHLLRNWQTEVMAWSPDVIVLHTAHYETIHRITPRWFERAENTLTKRPTRARIKARKFFVRPAYKGWVTLQAKVDRDPRIQVNQRKIDRAIAHTERYIQHALEVGSPLILIMEMLPQGTRFGSWFPGMNARIEATNKANRELVDRIGRPNVRFFEMRDFLMPEGTSPDEISPDGIHYLISAHRKIGEALAATIAEWADTQEHLALASS